LSGKRVDAWLPPRPEFGGLGDQRGQGRGARVRSISDGRDKFAVGGGSEAFRLDLFFRDTAWIVKTNQSWKIVLFAIVVCISALLFFPGEFLPDSLTAHLPDDIVLVLYGTAFSAIALLWIGFSIRCPICRKNVGGYMISTLDWKIWYTTLIKMESCPRCGK
jgi:hypothetical protein